MEKSTRFAFDLGGVIIERRGKTDNFLIEQSVMSVKLTVQKFGPENVFIISKGKAKYIQGNMDFLKEHNFFNETGFLQQNVYFVNDREEKGVLGKKLQLNYILDDKTIAAEIAIEAGFTPILFGDHQEFAKQNQKVINVLNWKDFRAILQTIKK